MNESLKTVINAVRAVTDSLANRLTRVEKKIPKVDTDLNKRGSAADSAAVGFALKNTNTKISKAQTAADNAQTAADNAQTAADNAHIIVEAVKLNSTTYSVTIDGFTLKPGAELTIIPNVTIRDQYPGLVINNGVRKSIKVGGLSNVSYSGYVFNTGGSSESDTTFLCAGYPTKLMFSGDAWVVQNMYTMGASYLYKIGAFAASATTNVDSAEPVKDIAVGYIASGRILSVMFKNGNTAEYPKLKYAEVARDIIDESGSPIQSMPVQAGARRFFIFESDKFYLLR